MTSLMKLAACAVVLAALAGCGEERGADGLTQSERDRLNAAAASLDGGPDVVDASPDSLVAADEANATEIGEAANGQ
ncbi:MAG TPA: hypothetical protein VF603_13300 [Allosphingosinicella sp.]|jgi:outer membrane murein-binding lipoprotein Lpp